MPAVAQRLAALGRIEPAGGLIAVGGPVGDRIVRLYPLVLGQELEAGQPIAELASGEERRRQVTIAEVELQELEARRAAIEQAGQAKLRVIQAEWEQTQAQQADDLAAQEARLDYLTQQVRIAEATLKRLDQLKANRVTVSAEEYDRARLTLAQAVAEQRGAQAARRKTQLFYQQAQRLAQLRQAAAQAELQETLARIPLESARARLEAAREQWQRLGMVRAPIRGQILQLHAHVGQTIGTEPLLIMADLSQMVVRTEIYQGDLERLREALRQGPRSAAIQAAVLPRPLRATLADDQALARLIAPNQLVPFDPRTPRDSRTVEALLTIHPDDQPLAARFLGLQATVVIDLTTSATDH
jgi:ABC exporter DevB family membrane fusion protein